MSRRYLILGLLAVLATLGHAQVPAAPGAASPNAATNAPDPWIDTLVVLLANRYQVTGQLHLSWNRPRPAAAPVDADLVVVTASNELAPQILVTVRATDSAGVVSEHMLVLRAELWRDGWMVRDLRTPFGGVKQSGVGREGGDDALTFWVEKKNVCISY
jgi:hypothetical protein